MGAVWTWLERADTAVVELVNHTTDDGYGPYYRRTSESFDLLKVTPTDSGTPVFCLRDPVMKSSPSLDERLAELSATCGWMNRDTALAHYVAAQVNWDIALDERDEALSKVRTLTDRITKVMAYLQQESNLLHHGSLHPEGQEPDPRMAAMVDELIEGVRRISDGH